MALDPATNHLTGTTSPGNAWAAALWSTPVANPVEVWATIARAGTNDAVLYADVTGGAPGHPTAGYFADFGGSGSKGSPDEVTIWRINGAVETRRRALASAPYHDLAAGDQIGLSVTDGAIIAWYRPAGGAWTAAASTFDTAYSSGTIALEALPGPSYAFSEFGGGTPSAPTVSTRTATTVTASASSVDVGGTVTYTATVSPAPSAPPGTIAFLDGTTPIPGCGAQTVNAAGQARCEVAYTGSGSHTVSAIYSGSPDGKFVGSTNSADAIVNVTQPPKNGHPSAKPTGINVSLSTATPLTGSTVTYTARVSPAPDGGTVTFRDGGKTMGGCKAKALSHGVAVCKLTYAGTGVHRISAVYSGDAHYQPSGPTVAQAVTVFKRPRLGVASHRLFWTVSCPVGSGGCRFATTVAITLSSVKGTVHLKTVSIKVNANQSARIVYAINASIRSKLSTYLKHHRHGHATATVSFVARAGNGPRGTRKLVFTIGSRDLGLL